MPIDSDHSLSENSLVMMGIPVLAPYHSKEIMARHRRFGNFSVHSFELPHDVPNYGFLIRHGTWSMVYMTDMEYSYYKFQKQQLNCMLIECNHITDLVDTESENFAHIVKGHASLDVTEGIVRENATEFLSNVILCHLSEVNADEDIIRERIEAAVPPFCTVSIAHKGEVYQL